MCKNLKKLVTIALIMLVLFPTRALGIPNEFRGCPRTKKAGITYVITDKYQSAMVYKCDKNRRTFTIPRYVRYRGKKYKVSAVWPETFEKVKKLKKVTIHADLECLEDPRLFDDHSVRVVTTDRGVYKWLKKGGVNIKYKK